MVVWVLLNCESFKRNDNVCVGGECPERACQGGDCEPTVYSRSGSPCQPTTTETVSTPSKVLAISAGDSYSCAIIGDGKAKCWGYHGGKLGHGCNYNWQESYHTGNTVNSYSMYNLPIDLGAGRSAKTISTGHFHTCVILDNDKVKCWGHDDLIGSGRDNEITGDDPGEMGDDLPIVDLGTNYTVKSIDVGASHTCAIISNGEVKCWGRGGLLGLGHAKSMGNAPNEMGDSLPVVDLGTGRTAKAISVGNGHACAILDNNTVKCWGDGQSAQLGLGRIPDRRSALRYPILNTSPSPSYNYIGDEEGEMGDSLPVVDLGTGRTAKAISAGGQHTCAILDDNTVKCWGRGNYGQLGHYDAYFVGGKPEDMGDNLLAVDLGTGRTAKAISTGSQYTCVIANDDTVRCWGRGDGGQLGQGRMDNWETQLAKWATTCLRSIWEQNALLKL